MKRASEALVGLSVLVAIALVVAGTVWLSQMVPATTTAMASSTDSPTRASLARFMPPPHGPGRGPRPTGWRARRPDRRRAGPR